MLRQCFDPTNSSVTVPIVGHKLNEGCNAGQDVSLETEVEEIRQLFGYEISEMCRQEFSGELFQLISPHKQSIHAYFKQQGSMPSRYKFLQVATDYHIFHRLTAALYPQGDSLKDFRKTLEDAFAVLSSIASSMYEGNLDTFGPSHEDFETIFSSSFNPSVHEDEEDFAYFKRVRPGVQGLLQQTSAGDYKFQFSMLITHLHLVNTCRILRDRGRILDWIVKEQGLFQEEKLNA